MKTARSLDSLLAPSSIAVVGASPDRTKIRGILFHQLSTSGYTGRLYPINPGYREIDGLKCYPSIAAVGKHIDLVLVAIPTESVLPVLEECAAAGVRNAVVLTSGFAEQGGEQRELQGKIAALAQRTGMRVCGPNAVGFYNDRDRVAATFSPAVEVRPGEQPMPSTERRVGVVSQSGGMAFTFYDYGRPLGLGFSYIVNTGNEVDLTLSDFFAYMVEDEATSITLLFIEGVRDPERFIAAAAAAAEAVKPVIVCKVGRSQAGERAAASHTANMTGWDAAYDAVFQKYGIIVANDPEEMTAVAAAFATCPMARGDRIAVITVSGGTGALASDALSAQGLTLPEISQAIQEKISALLPAYGSTHNPIDVTAQGSLSGGLSMALTLLSGSDEVDSILLVGSLASENRVGVDVESIKQVVSAQTKPVLFYSYTRPSDLACRKLAEAGLVVNIHLTWTARALRALVDRGRFKASPPIAVRRPVSFAKIETALRAARDPLSEYEAKELLAAFGIGGPPHRLVNTPAELQAAAASLGWPVALKIQSPDIIHKTEVGGVKLNIGDPTALTSAWEGMLAEVRRHKPNARLQGVLVQPMVPKGIEMIIGTIRDSVFGPIVMVGAGGINTELFKDVTYRPSPVSADEAHLMLRELRSFPLLEGWRGSPPADLGRLTELVAEVSAFAVAFGDTIQEIELNPVLVHPRGAGCTIVDALITARKSDGSAGINEHKTLGGNRR
jgi:acetate---CoA ligase (ADP-forming)